MGTRGAYGFRLNETDYIIYNHWDSYPGGLGQSILDQLLGQDIDQMREAVAKLQPVNDRTDHPTPELIEKYKSYADTNVGNQDLDDWYCLLRRTQGTIIPFLTGGVEHYIDGAGFLLDSLFCEWAYIINLDTEMLEIYSGFHQNPGDPESDGRYAATPDPNGSHRNTNYYGVRQIYQVPLVHVLSGALAGDKQTGLWEHLNNPEEINEDGSYKEDD